METDHSPVIVEKVLDGTVDAGFVYSKPLSPNIASIHVLKDTYSLYGHKCFAGTSLKNLKELTRLPWIYMNWGYHFENWLKAELGSDFFKPLIEVGHSELEMKLIEELEGVGFLPDEMVERSTTGFIPISMETQKTIPAQNVYFIYKKSREQEEDIRELAKKLGEE
ncbi:LysR substrate-binding domain-containing protein [Sediminibacillus dalangtanensis]|uniref:LysR substrate-binding domain-containing protein n=1 Tax=Sediminibacillus dalangtanensis TaxID=2729421 RepID=UPI001AE0865F|nr:LysR substrate-binding domain-containing protein [Sediminibacillus dalangtanensis]